MQVVACLLVRGVECRISVRVLCVVLLFEAGHQRLRVNFGLLRVHVCYRAHVLLADGQQRLLRMLLVSAICSIPRAVNDTYKAPSHGHLRHGVPFVAD